jgi:hypothetical protein
MPRKRIAFLDSVCNCALEFSYWLSTSTGLPSSARFRVMSGSAAAESMPDCRSWWMVPPNSPISALSLRIFRGRVSSTATLGALDRLRVQGPIVRLQPFLDVEHALVAAKGLPSNLAAPSSAATGWESPPSSAPAGFSCFPPSLARSNDFKPSTFCFSLATCRARRRRVRCRISNCCSRNSMRPESSWPGEDAVFHHEPSPQYEMVWLSDSGWRIGA